MPGWWNWYTRRPQVPLLYAIWVRVPFPAPHAGMMELVDKTDLKSVDFQIITGSNPVTRTTMGEYVQLVEDT